MGDQENSKDWWQRVRGKNRSLKGLISARRRFTARTERLAGKRPQKRQFSVPEIARRIGTPLKELKRMIRSEVEMSPAVLTRLAKDLDMPLAELRDVADQKKGDASGLPLTMDPNAEGVDPLVVLEQGLIASARALVALLRGFTAQGEPEPAARGRSRR